MVRAFLAASAAVLAIAAYPAASQDVAPAELPPESYTANQYIDSRGCAFVRAGIGGETDWVPRMSRQREQLCGFQPTPIERDEPVVAETDDAEAPEADAATATDERAAPREAAESPPEPARPAAAAAPAPRRSAAASPRPAPPPVKVSQAEFCVGRTGIQEGYVGHRSGKPIDCGPIRVSGQPPEGKVSLAEVCADMAVNGRRYKVKETGAPLDCGAYAVRPAVQADKPSAALAAASHGYRFVQIGAFAEPANAERATARLHAMGLPVALSRLHRGNTPLFVIATGPYDTAPRLTSVLHSMRAAGYRDAFLRR